MKKASRFAALLAAVMLFGSVAAMPALAEDATSTPVPTATAEPTVTPTPTDNGPSAPNNSGSAYIIAQTVTDAAGGEITTIDRDSRFNLILRVADYGAYNNFIPADQIQRCFLINRCRIKNTQKSSADHLINLGRQWV